MLNVLLSCLNDLPFFFILYIVFFQASSSIHTQSSVSKKKIEIVDEYDEIRNGEVSLNIKVNGPNP